MNRKKFIFQTFFWTFVLAIIFSLIANSLSLKANSITSAIIILIVISIGIIFDMIGAATLTSKEANFHAMNSKKVQGAKEALILIKNSVKVSSICNDIVGDICGIISGSLGAVLAIGLANSFNISLTFISMIIAALISSLTVGGKAIFKEVAVKNSDTILIMLGKIIHIFYK